jgi:riboflavin biosynthesis pyrimidine reductase
VRQLLPTSRDDVDPYEAYRPAQDAIVRLNMIASVDGAATDPEGRAGGLAGEGDRELFRTLRALADCILVGAETVRVEGYGPHRVRSDLRERRRADGRDAPAAIAIVTRSVALDFDAPLFTEAVTPTVVVTCEAADRERLAAARRAGRVLIAGDTAVDLSEALRLLRGEYGYAHVLSEGGPRVGAELIALGLLDELCLTIGPRLVGDAGPQIVTGLQRRVDLDLAAAYEQAGELFLRYTVRR